MGFNSLTETSVSDINLARYTTGVQLIRSELPNIDDQEKNRVIFGESFSHYKFVRQYWDGQQYIDEALIAEPTEDSSSSSSAQRCNTDTE